MPLFFAQLCDLLSALESISRRDPPLLPASLRQRYGETIKSWFTNHPVSIHSPDVDPVALLSTLFPAKRTDRVYHIQLKRLTKILKRCLCLGKDRVAILDQWQTAGRGDLGDCVERALQQAEFPRPLLKDRVTLKQVDNVLVSIARQCRFSGPKVRQREIEDDQEVLGLLGSKFQRMQSREAKWFTRLILKDFSCLELTEAMVYYYVDPRLRVAMQMYDDFEAAITELRSLPASQMIDASKGGWTQQCANDAHMLPPRIGVKVGPPKWVKAKGGVKEAVNVINGRTMSVERKHDGEYCQIHIDLTQGEDCIQIFSKSGKDSTKDRAGVHQAIKDGLRIGRSDCGFSEKCILEGELLVWSDKTKEILEFHKLRKHVSRSGSFLGTDMDSQPHPWEKLMIMFYDVLLIDDDPVLHRPFRERRKLLEQLVKPIKGRVGLLWQKHVKFSTPDGPRLLKQALAHAFVKRWEGLVLKPSDEPYFTLGRPISGRFLSRWIKLKKDCIKGLGDTADFAVLAAGYDVKEAVTFPTLDLKWTHFYIGCLRNKDLVLKSGAKPHILLFDKVSVNRQDLLYLNQHGQFPLRAMDPGSIDVSEIYTLEFASGLPRPSVIFRKPFVFDIAGSGFDKAPNRDIFTLRFPRVLRLHRDRHWQQAIGLEELQLMALEATTAPTADLTQEIAKWVDKLDHLDRSSRGHLPPWDYSDDEDEDPEALVEDLVTTSTARSVRPGRSPAAPPLVRMDTGEMRAREQRLSSGEVVERPNSRHSMVSITSNSSLWTPPSSSPEKKGRGGRSRSMSPPCFARKRTAHSIDNQDDIRQSKKVRAPTIQSKSASESRECLYSAAHKQPLGEITNSARPLLQHRDTEPAQGTIEPPVTSFSLVRKQPIGAGHDTQLRRKPRKLVEPSSPARETTASQSTTAGTTQATVIHDAVSAPLGPPADDLPTNTTVFATSPATAEHPMENSIRELRKRQVILSPSLVDDNHHFRNIMNQHLIKTSPFPSTMLYPATACPDRSIIVLVDQTDTHHTGKYVWSLVRYIPQWQPRTVRVWHWTAVEALLAGDIDDTNRRLLINETHVAKLWWDRDNEVVMVRWRDGEVTEITKKEVERAEAPEDSDADLRGSC